MGCKINLLINETNKEIDVIYVQNSIINNYLNSINYGYIVNGGLF